MWRCFNGRVLSSEIHSYSVPVHWTRSIPFSRTITMSEEHDAVLLKAFQMFDPRKSGFIEKDRVRTILTTLDFRYDDAELGKLLEGEDEGTGQINFDAFRRIAQHYQEEDDAAMEQELKEAFRLYDKAGAGYIPVAALREILQALDDKLNNDQLDEMIAEIDTDGSGTVDFDEFMEMMTGD